MSATLRRRAQAAWQVIVNDPTLHPADVLAAVVWPQDVELSDSCSVCSKPVKAKGLCAHHYWAAWNHNRKDAAA